MLRRFISWWNKDDRENLYDIVYSDESEKVIEEYCNRLSNGVEDDVFSYKTTIKRDLKKIAEIISPRFPFHLAKNIKIWEHLDEMYFYVSHKNTKEFEKLMISELKLQSLYIGSNLDGEDRWEMKLTEYRCIFENKHTDYQNRLLKLIVFIESVLDDNRYQYTFMRYEDSILFALNSLKESKEHLGEIDNLVLEEVKIVIGKLANRLNEIRQGILELEKKEKEAIRDGLVRRMKEEVEWVEQYVEDSIEKLVQ